MLKRHVQTESPDSREFVSILPQTRLVSVVPCLCTGHYTASTNMIHLLVNDCPHVLHHIEIYLIAIILHTSLSPWNRGSERTDAATTRVE
jgi:hypothetical protein